MSRTIFTLLATTLLLGANSALAKTELNIDFGLHGDHPAGATSVLYTGTAAAPFPGTTWNEVQVLDDNTAEIANVGEFGFYHADVTKSNLLNSQGVATPIGVTAFADPANSGAFGMLQGSTNLGCAATDAVDLMRDYLIALNNSTQHVTLSGFTPGTPVDLYLYGAGDTDNRDTLFTVTDFQGTHTTSTTGSQSPNAGSPVAHTLTLGGDYNVLTGVRADVNGKIDISYTHAGGSAEGPFDGLQAVYDVFTGVPGDVNGDLLVNNADYQIIKSNFRNTGATRAQGDLTGPVGGNFGDGIVDFYDFIQWQQAFSGPGSGAQSLGTVPEPASYVMALLGVICLAGFRSRRAKR